MGRGAERAEDAEQVSRVDRGLRARSDDQVVAGRLGVAAHAPREPPREGVEPVHGGGELGQQERRPVRALHVGELVEQDDAAALDGPLAGGAAEHEERAQDPRRHRDRHGFALDELDAAVELQAPRGGIPLDQPFDVADGPGLAPDLPDARPAHEEAERDGGRARDPGEEEQARRGRGPRGRSHRDRKVRRGSRSRSRFARRRFGSDGVLGRGGHRLFRNREGELAPGDLGRRLGVHGRGRVERLAGRSAGRAHVRKDRDVHLRERRRENRKQQGGAEAEGADPMPRGGSRASHEEERHRGRREDEGGLHGEVETEADGRVEHELHVSVPPCGPDR